MFVAKALAAVILIFCFSALWAAPRSVKQRYATEDRAVCEYILEADRRGKTDATAALQALIDLASEAGGGVIWCPDGVYRFDGSLRLRKGVTLRGDWQSPRKTGGAVKGTVFAVYANRGREDAESFITMEKVTGVVNLHIWYPEQDPRDITPYPWTISATDRGSCGYTVRNVNFVNSYKALSNGADDGEGYNVAFYSGLYGCPLKYGIWINLCLDITRFERLYFGPVWWERSGLKGAPAAREEREALEEWLFRNGEAFRSGLFDWLPLYDAEFEGYCVGLHFLQNSFGCPNGQLCRVRVRGGRTGLLADNAAIYGWCITDCEFTSREGPGCAGVRIGKACGRGPFMFHSCVLGRVEAEYGSAAALSFMECELRDHVITATGDCAVIACRQKASAWVFFSSGGDNAAASPGLRYSGPARKGAGGGPGPVSAVHARRPFFRPASGRVFSVREFGAKGDGLADDTAAFEAALEAGGKAGGTVYVPAGRYVITGPLTVPSGAELRGISEGPPHIMVPCSCILVRTGLGTEEGAFLSLSENSSLRGVSFWYPQARIDRETKFPWTVRALGKNCQVRDVCLANSYQGLDLASAGDTTGHVVSGLVGCCRRRGVFADNSREGTVENCHMASHYWDRNDEDLPFEGPRLLGNMHDVNNAMRRESESYVFAGCAGEQIRSAFSVFSHRGLVLKDGFRGSVINHGSDGTVFGIGLEGDVRCLLINTLAAPVPTLRGAGEYAPCDPANALYVNNSARSITADLSGEARLVNTAVWGFGDALLARGEGRLSLELVNSLLSLAALNKASVYGAYSNGGVLWTAPEPLCGEALFGSFGFLQAAGLRNCVREARVTASSQYVEGQGPAELADGFPLTFYASKQEPDTWIRFDFPEPRSIKYAVIVSAAPDGSGYVTRALDIYGETGEGREIFITGIKDNSRCVLPVPLEGRWKSVILKIREPNLFDMHTRIGEVLFLTGEDQNGQ